MSTFALYCKSYRGDLDRAQVLAQSVETYNKDNIPFYFSVPKEDLDLFKSSIPNVEIVCDDDIVDSMMTQGLFGWVTQQIVKSNFWKLGLAENYLVLDSDCQFIQNLVETNLCMMKKLRIQFAMNKKNYGIGRCYIHMSWDSIQRFPLQKIDRRSWHFLVGRAKYWTLVLALLSGRQRCGKY